MVVKAAETFHRKTARPNERGQSDVTDFKIIRWGGTVLSTGRDDFSRYIIAWKPGTTRRAEDAADTLALALKASGYDHVARAAQAEAAQR